MKYKIYDNQIFYGEQNNKVSYLDTNTHIIICENNSLYVIAKSMASSTEYANRYNVNNVRLPKNTSNELLVKHILQYPIVGRCKYTLIDGKYRQYKENHTPTQLGDPWISVPKIKLNNEKYVTVKSIFIRFLPEKYW